MPPPLPPPTPRHLLPPLIASLPAAALSSLPPAPLLPILSPILRQRVQLLSAATKDPWLPLLCYDPEKANKLSKIVQSDKFEPHPVSGEVEVDWDSEVETRYRRVDEETLEAYVALREFELGVKLIWCTGDQEGGGDGWRIGEVSTLDSTHKGWESIGEAEGRFKETIQSGSHLRDSDTLKPGHGTNGNTQPTVAAEEEEEDYDDDDAYWAQYDNTPARTPAIKRSPAPASMQNSSSSAAPGSEDAYYAQYASVQPAMDNHDPDEASQNGHTESTLNRSTLTYEPHDSPSPRDHDHQPLHPHDPDLSSSSHIWASDLLPSPDDPPAYTDPEPDSRAAAADIDSDTEVLQPRPTSSSSSSSSRTVEKLENSAAALGQSEIGVKQHISTSVKSLFRLARAAGMERGEFERLVRTELDVLGLMEEED